MNSKRDYRGFGKGGHNPANMYSISANSNSMYQSSLVFRGSFQSHSIGMTLNFASVFKFK